jgi:hypothetical protein
MLSFFYPEAGESWFLQEVGSVLPDCTVPHLKRQKFSNVTLLRIMFIKRERVR